MNPNAYQALAAFAVKVVPRVAVDTPTENRPSLTTICSWCTRANINGGWVYAEHVPGFTTHGICPDCESRAFGPSASRTSASPLSDVGMGGSPGGNLPAVTGRSDPTAPALREGVGSGARGLS
jgi:hypothetical protein